MKGVLYRQSVLSNWGIEPQFEREGYARAKLSLDMSERQ